MELLSLYYNYTEFVKKKENTYPREGKIGNLSLPDIFDHCWSPDRNRIDQLTRETGSCTHTSIMARDSNRNLLRLNLKSI